MTRATFTDPRQFLDYTLGDYGVQVYNVDEDSRYRWGVFRRQCPECAHEWVAVAAVGTCGIECPKCHELDMDQFWEGQDD